MEKDFTRMSFSEMFGFVDEVNRYFMYETQKIFLTEEMETFEQYLSHRYKNACYSYSFYALMGLKPDDYLVRGNIDIRNNDYCNYHHGWVEFKYQGINFIFDSLIRGIVTKEYWYDRYKPKIDYRKTQRAILDEFLNEKNAYKLRENIWQFKYYVMNSDKDNSEIEYDEASKFNKENGYVPASFSLSRIEFGYSSNKITKFIS